MAKQELESVLEETTEALEQTLDILENQVDRVVTVTKNNPFVVGAAFILGGVLAGVVAWKVSEKRTSLKYEDILTEEIAKAKEFHSRLSKTGEFESPESAVEALVPEDVVEAVSKYQGRAQKVPYNRPEEIKEEKPVDPRPPIVIEKVEVTKNVFKDTKTDPRDWDYNAEIADRELNPDIPYAISYEEFTENEPSHEQSTLAYYAGDDTLCDERDQPIDNTDYTVGDDNLTRFGHGSHDKNVVYVRNEKITMDFEIIRNPGSYSKEVLGYEPEPLRHSQRRNPRRSRSADE